MLKPVIVVGTVIGMRAAGVASAIVRLKEIRAKTTAWEAHEPEDKRLNKYAIWDIYNLVGTFVPEQERTDLADYSNSDLSAALPANYGPREDAAKRLAFTSSKIWLNAVHAGNSEQRG